MQPQWERRKSTEDIHHISSPGYSAGLPCLYAQTPLYYLQNIMFSIDDHCES